MTACHQLTEDSCARFPDWVGNRVTYSELHHFEFENYAATTYSIKYVLQGTEHYFAGNQKFSVSGGNFLLVNRLQPLDFLIHSRQKVKASCIHMDEHLIQDVYTQLQVREESRLDNPLQQLRIPEFEEIIYADGENNLGKYIKGMALNYETNTGAISVEPTALYQQLAQLLLVTQNGYLKAHGNLTAIKYSTKKELLRRLELAKEIMEDSDTVSFKMESIARQVMLSGSHFFRSFKKQYGISPYQYVLQKKLERTVPLLLKAQASVTDIALSSGFGDVASFSKAFKKQFGVPPMQYIQSGQRSF